MRSFYNEDDEDNGLNMDFGLAPSFINGGAASSGSDYDPVGEPDSDVDDQSLNSFINDQAAAANVQDGPLSPVRLDPTTRARSDELADYTNQRNRGSFMQEAYSDMRADALKRSQQGFGIEDAIFPAIAAVLDATTNRGKGLGNIAMGTLEAQHRVQDANHQAVNDLGNLSLAEAKNQQHLQDAAWQQEYRNRMMGISEGNLDLRGRELLLDRDREERLGRAKAASPLDASVVAKNQAEAAKLAAETQYLTGHEGQNPAQVAQAARDQANADYRQRRDAEEDAFKRKDDERADKQLADTEKAKAEAARLVAEKLKNQRTLPPGTTMLSEGLWNAAADNEVTRRKVLDGVSGYQSALRAIERMKEIRADVGSEVIPGEATGEWAGQQNIVVSGLGEAAKAGILQPADLERFTRQVPSLAPHLSDIAGFVNGNDPTADALTGVSKSFRDTAGPRLAQYGIGLNYEDDAFKTERQRAAAAEAMKKKRSALPAAPLQQPNAVAGRVDKDPALLAPAAPGQEIDITNFIRGDEMPQGGFDVPADLGVKTPVAPIPLGNGRAQAAGNAPMGSGSQGLVKMVAPDGSEKDVPEADVDFYISKGARVK